MTVEDISNINDWNNFIQNVLLIKNNKFVIDVYATYCGPCKAVKPKYEELSNKYIDIPFISIDIEKFPEFADKFDISCMPTFLIFKNGKIEKRITGADLEAVENAILQ
jgi:thioredoxin 1